MEKISVDPDKFVAYLLTLPIVDHGSRTLIFGAVTPLRSKKRRSRDLPNIIRLPIFNSFGKEKMSAILKYAIKYANDEHLGSEFSAQIKLAQVASNQEYLKMAKNTSVELMIHVAAANSNFCRDPQITIPINNIYYYNGKPIATFEKRIIGRHPQFESEYSHLLPFIQAIGGDYSNRNIFFDVSPYRDNQGELQHLHPLHIIDFHVFVPSNKDI